MHAGVERCGWQYSLAPATGTSVPRLCTCRCFGRKVCTSPNPDENPVLLLLGDDFINPVAEFVSVAQQTVVVAHE